MTAIAPNPSLYDGLVCSSKDCISENLTFVETLTHSTTSTSDKEGSKTVINVTLRETKYPSEHTHKLIGAYLDELSNRGILANKKTCCYQTVSSSIRLNARDCSHDKYPGDITLKFSTEPTTVHEKRDDDNIPIKNRESDDENEGKNKSLNALVPFVELLIFTNSIRY